ncbi:DsbE family thiol:disulfide interchange protein [Legionella jamestowniensis]|uniref:Cytochrome C biogenesis protein n=1 Tax=Legionella jamestowniensis TaxID=455 RepID=A0A0W0UFS2_9GAMM|nr:DsbE family thiol:disulfide interchange protein [Legionella jamestowniensis]KTD06725.1 cytochrome C biogenesis protein [Legionella jamestowniensis]OCH97392.1 thiol:disulfide interchange protein [Legionella jamestowniensis]SFL84127.1 cytochrome c biogenesis protein CcmG, thiol:disulfide interchange protein DsbE [Legionella jamestowniensis DSM 19215]
MKFWRLIPLFFFVLLVLFLWRGLSLEPQTLPSAKINQALPAFQLTSLGSGHPFTPKILQGQVSLLNVWASWCSACIEEQVFLMQLSREGVPIYGLNYKDDTQNATQWLKEWGNPYRAIGEDHDGSVAIDLGVYGAPETFLIDKKGVIRFRHVGILNDTSWNTEFLPRMKLLQEEA